MVKKVEIKKKVKKNLKKMVKKMRRKSSKLVRNDENLETYRFFLENMYKN